MERYEDIKKISEEAYIFLQELQSSFWKDGKYELGNGVYVNIESYVTQERSSRQFENHRQYIDIQVMLDGEEIIEICPIKNMIVSIPYNAEKDIIFYANSKLGTQQILKRGEYLIIYPGQAHMPCVRVQKSVGVRKAVIKIPFCRLKYILFMDIDGTLTDGKIYIGNTGELMKAFSVKDGYAITHLLSKADILPVIITGRKSEIVSNRCRELGINVIFQDVSNKKETMIDFANSYGLYMDESGIIPHTYYIGDDIPDLECMLIAEKKGCPADAADEIKAVSDFISARNGGDGAVREFIEWVSKKNQGSNAVRSCAYVCVDSNENVRIESDRQDQREKHTDDI
ncbi:MAG: YhcH/YjgK/YiaL family protein [Lachnospiraceae bacterium]|nr:YhcH/YjgK/YiaL family protein [Muribaculaceae bacterium]MCM1409727.1 YhcH/YjgK/YiaL family protein [Lachnospiraceae bacterium]